MSNLKLCTIEDKDIPLLEKWLNKDYVIKWYVEPEAWLHEVKERFNEFKFVSHYIVTLNEKPIGFCQYYTCSDAGEDWYGDITLNGTYSIDYLIGEEEYLGKGFGKSIVYLLTQKIFSLSNAKKIIAKPEFDNKASCNTLLSNGFIYDQRNMLYLKER